jgi:hypothetical protein
MWSDELDNKMKEATEGYQPAYDDKAWDKMEVLLDKHLPLEKKRRRFIFLLLPLLLAGTGIFFLLQKKDGNGISKEKNTVIQPKSLTIQSEKGSDIAAVPSKIPASKQATVAATVQQDLIAPSSAESKPAEKRIQNQLVVSGDISNDNNRKKVKKIFSSEQQFEQQHSSGRKKYDHKTKDQENNFAEHKPSEQNTLVPVTEKNSVNNLSNIIPDVSSDKPAISTPTTQAAEEKKLSNSSDTKNAIAKVKPQKQRKPSGGKFSLSFSAGPDISSIGIDNPGKWTLQYGIGFSYALSKRLSIRTGFFAGHKIYTADSTEYHSRYYPPKLQRIEANCLVYEIPVSLIYNFSGRKKHNWFVAGGLSSYLMKKETYDYYYKNAWGQMQNYSHIYKNENSHILSVINISGGYQYHFTDRLSLMAEPYVRIPVSGVGSGKVKLNSGGVLFSLGFKPFLKKN